MLPLNKQGDSVMVGYVILIAIAVALSTAVFFYLKLYLPPEKPTCPHDIHLVIDSVSCTYVPVAGSNPLVSTVDIVLSNRGLFSVDSAYIKIGDIDRVYKTTLNDPDADRFVSSCNNNNLDFALKPGTTFCKRFTYASAPSTLQEVTVEPLLWVDNTPVLCPGSIVKKRVSCLP